MFDDQELGYIPPEELTEKLKQLNVYAREDEIYLLYKKFDKDGLDRLSYKNYLDILLPAQHAF